MNVAIPSPRDMLGIGEHSECSEPDSCRNPDKRKPSQREDQGDSESQKSSQRRKNQNVELLTASEPEYQAELGTQWQLPRSDRLEFGIPERLPWKEQAEKREPKTVEGSEHRGCQEVDETDQEKFDTHEPSQKTCKRERLRDDDGRIPYFPDRYCSPPDDLHGDGHKRHRSYRQGTEKRPQPPLLQWVPVRQAREMLISPRSKSEVEPETEPKPELERSEQEPVAVAVQVRPQPPLLQLFPVRQVQGKPINPEPEPEPEQGQEPEQEHESTQEQESTQELTTLSPTAKAAANLPAVPTVTTDQAARPTITPEKSDGGRYSFPYSGTGSDPNKLPVSALNELLLHCAVYRRSKRTGPDGTVLHTCSVITRTHFFPGKPCADETEAKQAVAREILAGVFAGEITFDASDRVDPVTALKEYCQSRKFTKPWYEFWRIPKVGWSCTVTVNGRPFTAMGPYYHQLGARRAAAMDALRMLESKRKMDSKQPTSAGAPKHQPQAFPELAHHAETTGTVPMTAAVATDSDAVEYFCTVLSAGRTYSGAAATSQKCAKVSAAGKAIKARGLPNVAKQNPIVVLNNYCQSMKETQPKYRMFRRPKPQTILPHSVGIGAPSIGVPSVGIITPSVAVASPSITVTSSSVDTHQVGLLKAEGGLLPLSTAGDSPFEVSSESVTCSDAGADALKSGELCPGMAKAPIAHQKQPAISINPAPDSTSSGTFLTFSDAANTQNVAPSSLDRQAPSVVGPVQPMSAQAGSSAPSRKPTVRKRSTARKSVAMPPRPALPDPLVTGETSAPQPSRATCQLPASIGARWADTASTVGTPAMPATGSSPLQPTFDLPATPAARPFPPQPTFGGHAASAMAASPLPPADVQPKQTLPASVLRRIGISGRRVLPIGLTRSLSAQASHASNDTTAPGLASSRLRCPCGNSFKLRIMLEAHQGSCTTAKQALEQGRTPMDVFVAGATSALPQNVNPRPPVRRQMPQDPRRRGAHRPVPPETQHQPAPPEPLSLSKTSQNEIREFLNVTLARLHSTTTHSEQLALHASAASSRPPKPVDWQDDKLWVH